jgi:hypothetical protein
MSAQLAETEFPARERLREAQAALAAALVAAEAAAAALARGREHLSVLEGARDAAKAEIVDEAKSLAETFAENGTVAMIGGSAQRGREIDDELAGFRITIDILIRKNAAAQQTIGECDAAVEAAVKSVIEEETKPRLARLWDNEMAAALLRLELQALQFSGRWGLCPDSLPAMLRAKPANVVDPTQPLAWGPQQRFNKRKVAWTDFADRLRTDPNATLSIGD